jgi:hypothetical protein
VSGNARRGVLGGLEPDPDKGKPHRHTRQKARLMMGGMDDEQLAAVLQIIIDKRPEEALDAILEVAGELEKQAGA